MYNPYQYQYNYPFVAPQNGLQPSFDANSINNASMLQNANQQNQNGLPSISQVNTIKQVEQIQVHPGGKMLVLVANEPVIAMRMADNMGLTTTDYYKIAKFDPESSSNQKDNDYVTRAEFQQFIDSLKVSKKSVKKEEIE